MRERPANEAAGDNRGRSGARAMEHDEMRPVLYYSDDYEADIGPHVFPMRKYRLVKEKLLSSGIATDDDFAEPAPATIEDALLVHTRTYVAKLLNGTLSPLEERTLEVPYSRELVEKSFLTAGGTIAAVRSAFERGVGVNIGGGLHHAFPDHGEGFCVLNDPAMSVARALEDGLAGRVAMVDCDVHQGNGTAAIFAGDERVFTFSIHHEHNYPMIKPPSDLDIGLPNDAGGDLYLTHLESGLRTIFDEFEPEMVLFIAGADPFERDLLGGLSLTKSDLADRDAVVMEACAGHGVPFVVTLAGGYAEDTADTVDIHASTIARAVAAGESLAD
jgi:acetoin utilization deacetylase AcuC-like enzyme